MQGKELNILRKILHQVRFINKKSAYFCFEAIVFYVPTVGEFEVLVRPRLLKFYHFYTEKTVENPGITLLMGELILKYCVSYRSDRKTRNKT